MEEEIRKIQLKEIEYSAAEFLDKYNENPDNNNIFYSCVVCINMLNTRFPEPKNIFEKIVIRITKRRLLSSLTRKIKNRFVKHCEYIHACIIKDFAEFINMDSDNPLRNKFIIYHPVKEEKYTIIYEGNTEFPNRVKFCISDLSGSNEVFISLDREIISEYDEETPYIFCKGIIVAINFYIYNTIMNYINKEIK